MKMTMHIDEDVLAQVMELTGAKTKTQAVELALTEMARRHKQKKLFSRGLDATPDELEAFGNAVMAAQTDPMDIDEAAAQRFIAKSDARSAAKQARELKVAEDQAPYRTDNEQPSAHS
ncbi:MAG TPA: type II toxin-antitoxin system VapB family antitoxin [Opitutaceae bacterium]|nr:type II toxin-antitoxin system VapB family antitoxin [Opitutaceae bacterium]